MSAPRWGNVRGGESRARPAPCGNVKDVNAIVVRCALPTADDNDLAPNERRRVRATRWRQVALHLGMCPLHRLCQEVGLVGSAKNTKKGLKKAFGETHAPILKHHMSLKHPPSSQPPNNHATLSASVTVCARTPCVGSDPQTGALLQYITGGGAGSTLVALGRWGIRRWRGAGSSTGARGGLAAAAAVEEEVAAASRAAAESELELADGFGVGRRRAAELPFVVVGESPGVERRDEADCCRAVARVLDDDTRSVGVDADGLG